MKTVYKPKWICYNKHIKKLRAYAYDIIEKAYWINEKKIEMLDFQKDKKLLEDYYEYRKAVTKCKKS